MKLNDDVILSYEFDKCDFGFVVRSLLFNNANYLGEEFYRNLDTYDIRLVVKKMARRP